MIRTWPTLTPSSPRHGPTPTGVRNASRQRCEPPLPVRDACATIGPGFPTPTARRSMTPDRYARMCEIAEAAWALPAGDRPAFLAQACARDNALRAEIEAFLAQDEAARQEEFLHSCPVALRTPSFAGATDADTLPPGQRLGPYEIQEMIASGGMGSVYRALRVEDYTQQVAVKLIKSGLNSGEVLRRFRAEREIQAHLEHAHIARLLDGGTTPDGRPYLVMEYIAGEPLTRYCDGRHLDTRQRVELLTTVCAAVHHAHQKGIIHR